MYIIMVLTFFGVQVYVLVGFCSSYIIKYDFIVYIYGSQYNITWYMFLFYT